MGAPDPAFSGRVPPSCSPIYRLRNLSPPPAAQVPLLLKSTVRPPRCRTHSALNPEPVRISGEDSVFLPAVFALTADGGVRRPAAYSPSFRRGKGPAGSTSPFAALRKSGLSRTFASTGSPAGCAHSSGFIVGIRFLTWNSCVEALLILCFAYRSHFPVCDNSVHFPAESIHHSGAPSGVCGATPTFRTSERL